MQKNCFCDWSAQGSNCHITTPTEERSGHTVKKLQVVAKTLLVMKLTIVLLTAGFLNVSAAGLSQNITFSGKNVSLETIFHSVKKQTGVVFLYTGPVLKLSQPITISASDMPLENFLKEVFKSQPLKYSIDGKSILVAPKFDFVQRSKHIEDVLTGPPFLLSGRILDEEGMPLFGATISVKNSKNSGISDAEGAFSVKVNEGDVLVITYVGRQYKEIKIISSMFNAGIISITLSKAASPLDEIRIIAYGEDTKRYSVGAVSTVSAKEIQDQPVTNLFEALQGRVPGMVVTSANGAPGSISLTQIRGQNSLSSTPDQFMRLENYDQPLYIIDGVPLAIQNMPLAGSSLANAEGVGIRQYLTGLSSINGINPADIESISVLKDADATSIYGSRGSNGVILITTKKGMKGKDKVEISINTGFTKASRMVSMMNTQQYLEMRNEALNNSGMMPNPFLDPDLLIFDTTKYTDWKKEFFGGVAQRTDAHISVSGGNQLTRYLVSGGYTRETYNYPGSYWDKRYSLHTSFNHTSRDNHFTIDFGTDYSFNENNSTGGGPTIFTAFTMAPNFPDLFDANNKLVWDYKGFQFNTDQGNPLSYTKQFAKGGIHTLNSHLSLKYQLFSGLNVIVNTGYSRISQDFFFATPIASQNPIKGPTGGANFIEQNDNTINIEPQLNFKKHVSQGILTALVGGTYSKNNNSGTQISAGNYNSDALLTSIAAAGSPPIISNNASYYKYVAGFARINYTWKGKYIINLTGNRNGSSNFGPGKQFGHFGSAGLGWILTEEKGIRDVISFIDFAKLSASYGTSGSDGIAPYQYQPNWTIGASTGYQGLQGLNPLNPLNPMYAWSLNKKFNTELDLALFRDKIFLNFTYYQNRSSDQLVAYAQPIQVGFANITANAPYVVQNKGIEVVLTTKNIITQHFQWTSNFNVSRNSNKLLNFPDIASSPYANIYVVGKPLFSKFVVPYKGVDPQTGIYTFLAKNGTVGSSVIPNSGFNNLGGDATEIVDLAPKFTGGFNNSFTYKGFRLSVFFQFAVQRGPSYLYSIYSNFLTSMAGSPLVNQPAAMLGRWQKPGDVAEIQRFSAGFYSLPDIETFAAAKIFTRSTGAYTDASYIRLKNVSLSYSLPSVLMKRLFIKECAFYINAQNLFLITSYKIGDPEIMSVFNIPPQRIIVSGLRINF